jgi:hypothetical protein
MAREVVAAIEALLDDATRKLRARVTIQGRAQGHLFDSEQRATHGLAWLATYVEAIRQLTSYAERLHGAGRLGESEELLVRIGIGEYLAQISGGIAMSQGEIARLADIGLSAADVAARWTAALDKLIADRTLSTANRIWAVSGKVSLARLDNKDGPLPEALLTEVREQAARADRETTDINERQSVINSAGAMLARAALLDESDALLTAELKRSHSPYYYMLGLASNARRRGDKAAAIDWARQAYETSKGPATRLQWGASYVRYLLELAPKDAAQIEKASAGMIGELEPRSGAYSGRSQFSLERMSERLVKWNKDGSNDEMLKRLNAQLAPVCAKATADSADRRTCEGLFAPAKRA